MVQVCSIDRIPPAVHPDAYARPGVVLIGDVHAGARIAARGMMQALK